LVILILKNKERRLVSMISAEAAKGDIQKFIDKAKDVKVVGEGIVLLLMGLLVLLKVVLNCRTNTVKILDKLGIPREEKKADTKTKVEE